MTVQPPKGASVTALPNLLHAFDGGEWRYYVGGHDTGELFQVDELDVLQWEKLWLRAVPASQADNYGVFDEDSDVTVLRDPETGRFTARLIWLECREDDAGAEPFLGVRYKRRAT